MAREAHNPKVVEMLYVELGRAELHAADGMPPNVVTMNCTVEFIDEKNGMLRMLKVVYPRDEDIGYDRLSTLTRMGAGLIGMMAGETIACPDRTGVERILRFANVRPPENPDTIED